MNKNVSIEDFLLIFFVQAVVRDNRKIIEKLPISTGFTPENETGEAAALFAKKKHQQEIVKNHLSK